MAKIIITIEDAPPANGKRGVLVGFEGDWGSDEEPTEAQTVARIVKRLMDAVEHMGNQFTAAKPN